MPIADKIAALIQAVNREGFESMRPAERRHLRDLCRYIADKADPDVPPPVKAGVLHDLRNGRAD